MVDGSALILMKQKFRALREKCQDIFSLSMTNTSSRTISANIFDNKGGLTGANAITGYSQDEISGWNADGADRMIGVVYDPVNSQMVAVRSDFSWTNNYWYRINNDTLLETLVATVPYSGTKAVTNISCIIYNPFNGRFYDIYPLSAGGFAVQSRANNLIGASGYASPTAGSFTFRDIAINPVTGVMYVLDVANLAVWFIDPTTHTGISHVVTGAADVNLLQYIPQTNELWIYGDDGSNDKLYVMDATTFTVSEVFSEALNVYGGSKIKIVDGLAVSFENTSSSIKMVKRDPSTKAIVYNKTLAGNPFGLGQYIKFHTDDKDNFFIYSSQKYWVYDKQGNFLSIYDKDDRTVFGGGSGSIALGAGLDSKEIVGQRFNPSNASLYIAGGAQSIFASRFNYLGGLSGLSLVTSACSYQMAVTEFNTEPILVTGLIFFYQNGGASLNNLIRYLREKSTGSCERRLIQPRSYISAQDSSDKVVEIDLCDRPLVIDSSHYLNFDVNAGETVTMVMFYKQVQKKDLLLNKILG